MSETETQVRRHEPLAVTQIQAARLLNVSERTIRNWDKRGIIQSIRIGRTRRYPYAELKKLVS